MNQETDLMREERAGRNSGMLSIPGILRRGLALYRSRFSDFFSLTLAVALPANFLTILGEHNDRLDPYLIPSPLPLYPAVQTLFLIAGIALTPLFILASIRIAAEANQERELHWREAFHQAVRFWGRAILANLLAALYTMLFSLLLLFPGIARAVSYSFVDQAIAIRDKGIPGSLDYSRSLVKGHWWRVFFTLVASGLVPYGYMVILYRIAKTLQNPGLMLLLTTIGSLLIPFYVAAETELFFALERQPVVERESEGAPDSLFAGGGSTGKAKESIEKHVDRNPYG